MGSHTRDAPETSGNKEDLLVAKKEIFLRDSTGSLEVMNNMVWDSFNNYLIDVDKNGMTYGRIDKEDLFEAVRLHPKYQITWREAESILQQINKRPWPTFEEADRTSIYPQL